MKQLIAGEFLFAASGQPIATMSHPKPDKQVKPLDLSLGRN